MDIEKDILYESLAIVIHDHIKDLQQDATMQSARRWIWELMQNAVDLVDIHQGLSVYVSYSNSQIIFSHNGKPFDAHSLNHLFFKKSSKRNKAQNDLIIGQFGTGFLTTHLLSKTIYISGLYQKENGNYIEGTEVDIKNNLHKFSNQRIALENQTQTIQLNKNKIDNTKFRYPLTGQNQDFRQTSAKVGIQDFQSSIMYAMFFISQIKPINQLVIQIEDQNLNQTIQKIDEYIFQESIRVFSILDQHNNQIDLMTMTEDGITILFPTTQFKFIKRSPQTPNLFLIFPIIGTEDFNFPFFINSTLFRPSKERNRLILDGPDTDTINQNKRILEQTLTLSQKFIQIVAQSEKFSDLHNLADISMPPLEGANRKWYLNTIYLDYKRFVFNQPLVKVENGQYVSLSGVKIPYHRDKQIAIKLRNVFGKIMHSQIPHKEVFEQWYDLYLQDKQDWPNKGQSLYELKDYLQYLSSFKEISMFYSYFNDNQQSCFEYFNELIKLTSEVHGDMLNMIDIIPNQYLRFINLKKAQIDKNVPNRYLDVLANFDQKGTFDMKQVLVHPMIQVSNCQKYCTLRSLMEDVIEYIKSNQKISFVNQCSAILLISSKNKMVEEFYQLYKKFNLDIYYANFDEECNLIEEQQKFFISYLLKRMLERLSFGRCLSNLVNAFPDMNKDEYNMREWICQIIEYCFQYHFYSIKQFELFPTYSGELVRYDQIILDNNLNLDIVDIHDGMLNYYKSMRYFDGGKKTPKILNDQLIQLDIVDQDIKTICDKQIVKQINQICISIWNQFNVRYDGHLINEFMTKPGFLKFLNNLYKILSIINIQDQDQEQAKQDGNQERKMICTLLATFFKVTQNNQQANLVRIKTVDIKHIYKLSVVVIINLVVQKKNMIDLQNYLKITEQKLFVALNLLYEALFNFLEKSESQNIIDTWSIFPNQEGDFMQKGNLVRLDNDINGLKEVPLILYEIYDLLLKHQLKDQKNKGQKDQLEQKTLGKKVQELLHGSIHSIFQFKDFKASSLLRTIDNKFNSYRNQLDRNTVNIIFIFKEFDKLLKYSDEVKIHIPKFIEEYASIYLQLFSDFEERQKVLQFVKNTDIAQFSEFYEVVKNQKIPFNQFIVTINHYVIQQLLKELFPNITYFPLGLQTLELVQVDIEAKSHYFFIVMNPQFLVRYDVFNQLKSISNNLHLIILDKNYESSKSDPIFIIQFLVYCKIERYKQEQSMYLIDIYNGQQIGRDILNELLFKN